MSQMPNHRPVRRALLAAGCALLLGGCVTWSDQPAPLPTVQRTLHGPMRITRGDGYSVTLNEADVRGDSLIGLSTEYRRVAVPLADVKRLERHRTDVLGTVAAAAVVVAAVFGAYVYTVLSLIDD